jgi:hypothetical protein
MPSVPKSLLPQQYTSSPMRGRNARVKGITTVQSYTA